MKKYALFIGRFQPPHKGHQKAISRLLKKYKTITIAIGSSNEFRTQKNPFSARERLNLLKKLIPSKSQIRFSFLPDNPSNKKWTNYVQKRFSKEKYAICSTNSLVKKLLKNACYEFDSSPLYNRLEWEGTKIRKLISENKPYEKRIPKEILKYMKNKGEKIITLK